MDNAVFNICKLETSTMEIFLATDLPQVRQQVMRLPFWGDIFKEQAQRIMICGERSVGKTTLLKKIAYDWATDNLSCLKKYRFVFYVDLSVVKVRKPFTSLSECVVEQCRKL